MRQAAYGLMTPEQLESFKRELEIDFAISEPGLGRFRVNVFYQRGYPGDGAALHHAPTCRKLDELGLPDMLKDLVMMKRGLILMVGATGSGKSTSLAAMINHRNEISSDHIVTIEDPIEFLHTNKRSIVNQREVGLDTKSFARALRGAMRAAPDVILIGEIRDQRDHGGRDHSSPAPATWCWRRCTPTTAPRRWTASSTCSRRTSTRRSSWTCRSTCAPSCRSAWCVGKDGKRMRGHRGHAQHAAHHGAGQEGRRRRRSRKPSSHSSETRHAELRRGAADSSTSRTASSSKKRCSNADSRSNLEAKINFG